MYDIYILAQEKLIIIITIHYKAIFIETLKKTRLKNDNKCMMIWNSSRIPGNKMKWKIRLEFYVFIKYHFSLRIVFLLRDNSGNIRIVHLV